MATPKKQWPLIRYAGSAAETSIGSKPIGSELRARAYSKLQVCQAHLTLVESWRVDGTNVERPSV
jgi:hypothetical protein